MLALESQKQYESCKTKKKSDLPIDLNANFDFFYMFGKNSDILSLLVTYFFHHAQTS